MGIEKDHIMILSAGDVLSLSEEKGEIIGRVPAQGVFVDGLGVGDVGHIVLRDRKHLSQDGILTVVVTIQRETGLILAGPDIISRGFVYVRESEELMDGSKQLVREILDDCLERQVTEWSTIKTNIRDGLREFLYEKTKRKPMILPIIMEV